VAAFLPAMLAEDRKRAGWSVEQAALGAHVLLLTVMLGACAAHSSDSVLGDGAEP